MPTYTEVATILQKSLGQEEGLLVLEYLTERIPPDVVRRQDISETEAALRQDVSEAVAATDRKISAAVTATERKIGETEAALRREIEHVRLEIEKVRADLSVQMAETKVSLLRWAFLFWLGQIAVLGGLMFQLLR